MSVFQKNNCVKNGDMLFKGAKCIRKIQEGEGQVVMTMTSQTSVIIGQEVFPKCEKEASIQSLE